MGVRERGASRVTMTFGPEQLKALRCCSSGGKSVVEAGLSGGGGQEFG